MSASKMRAAAMTDDYDSFKNGLPETFGQGMSLFKDVRKFMGVRESFVARTETFTEEDVARDMYIRGEILNIGDTVTESYSGVSGKIIRRGTNYLVFSEQDGTTHKKWLYELDEMSTGELIRQVISKTTKKKGYDKAAEVLKTVIDRKKKENDLSHDIIYYATQIAKTFKGIDGRTLARTYSRLYEGVKQDKDIKDRKGTEPAKYYAKDADGDEMSVSTKKKRAAHFAKSKDGPAPGDKDADTKPSKHTKKFNQMFGEDEDPCWDTHKQVGMKKKNGKMVPNCVAKEDFQLDEKIEGLVTKADKSGISYSILKKVYDRGMAAWKTGHRPGTTPQQWAFARVNSFVTKSSGTWGKADKDLAQQVRGESVEVLKNAWGEITEKDDKSGKELNNPTKGDVKKYKVYVRNAKGNVVKVEFGDPNMEIKRDDPARRKAFRARHNCDTKKDKTTAGYWSCKFWSGKSVTDLMKG
jgi:hypothetical protein